MPEKHALFHASLQPAWRVALAELINFYIP
jgi:hypothetical protein